jgi:hypothetical protein
MEVTDPSAIVEAYSYGLLPGWLLGTEEYRQWGPLVDAQQ